MKPKFHYKAFLSYSHKDRRWGKWLLKALETYKIPKHLVGQKTKVGVVPSRLIPIFRDRDELATSEDLTNRIKEALVASEFLIVVCSPNAANSKWVNKEILEFKRRRERAKILCVIVEGEMNASTSKILSPDLECLPEALRNKKGKKTEILAADLRSGGEGKRLALLKLISGIIGVELDEIIQRDLQRRNRRVMAITLASVALVITMGGLTMRAMKAERVAEQRKADAEGLIEFMLTDLRDRLERVGRLDILDAVGEKAVNYYAGQQLQDLSEDSLGRRARAFHLLGEIDDLRGNLEDAQIMFETAREATGDMLLRNPDDLQRIFDHSQSVFWVGLLKWQRGKFQSAEEDFYTYLDLAENLVELDPVNPDWKLEVAYAQSNIGTLLLQNLGRPKDALNSFYIALSEFQRIASARPDDISAQHDLADAHAWVADAALIVDHIDKAKRHRQLELKIYERLLSWDNKNMLAKREILGTWMALAKLEFITGNIEEAEALLLKASNEAANLIKFDPENDNWQEQAAVIALRQARVLLAASKIDEAEIASLKAYRWTAELIKENPSISRRKVELYYQGFLIEIYIAEAEGKYEGAREIAKHLLKIMSEDTSEDQQTLLFVHILSETALVYADLLQANKEFEASQQLRQEVVNSLEKEIDQLGPDTKFLLVRALIETNQLNSAEVLLKEIQEQGYQPIFSKINQNGLVN